MVPILIGVGGLAGLAIVLVVVFLVVGGGGNDDTSVAAGASGANHEALTPTTRNTNERHRVEPSGTPAGANASLGPVATRGESQVSPKRSSEAESAPQSVPVPRVGGGLAASGATGGTGENETGIVDSRTIRSIIVPNVHPIIYTNGPVVGLIDKVISLETGQVVGTFDVEPRSNRGWFRLSDDGKWFATVEREGSANRLRWSSTQTGAEYFIEIGKSSSKTFLMYFLNNERLVWIGDFNREPTGLIFELNSAEPIERFPLEKGYTDGALHPDGKHVALNRRGEIDIIDTETGQIAGQMKFKGSVHAFAFSPDGTELALVTRYHETALVVVDQSGREKYRAPVTEALASGSNYHSEMQWFPDGSGWFLHNNTVLDRKSKLLVYELSRPWNSGQLLDNQTFAGAIRTNNQIRFLIKRMPTEKIEAAINQHLATATALVRPKPTVALKFQFGNLLGGSQEELIERYTRIWTEKLTAVEATPGDNGDYELQVTHDEQLSEPTSIGVVEGPNLVGRVINKEIRQPMISATVRLIDKQGRTVWTETVASRNATGFPVVAELPKLDDMRKTTLENFILRPLQFLRLPKVISGENAPVLPVVE